MRDHVLELRNHVLTDVAWLIIEPQRVIPLVERVVDAHAQAFATHRSAQVAQQIALRAFSTAFHGLPQVADASLLGHMANPS